MNLVRIRINKIPFADSLGNPWDPNDGPDIIIMMYDPTGRAILGAGDVIVNLRPEQLPIDLRPGGGAVELARNQWGGIFRIDFHELEIGVAPFGRLLGQVSFCVNTLISTEGYQGVYSLESDSLKVDIGVEWE